MRYNKTMLTQANNFGRFSMYHSLEYIIITSPTVRLTYVVNVVL